MKERSSGRRDYCSNDFLIEQLDALIQDKDKNWYASCKILLELLYSQIIRDDSSEKATISESYSV